MMINFKIIVGTWALGMILLFGIWPVTAQTTEFTFKGQMPLLDFPQNGIYDFEFRLFNSEAGGTQMGVVVRNGIQIQNGSFSADLDFGAQFDGGPRWVQTGVALGIRTADYTNLGARREIKSVPYAIRSLTSGSTAVADTAINAENLGGVPAGQYVLTTDPRMSDERPPAPGSGNYIQNSAALQGGTNFNISNTGIADIFDARNHFRLNGTRVLWTSQLSLHLGVDAGPDNVGGHNTFIGNGAGQENTDGVRNTYVGNEAGRSLNGTQNSVFGFGIEVVGTFSGSENSFFGAQSAFGFTGGNRNSFFGGATGTTTSGDNNSYFGFGAGASGPPTIGNGNTFIGYGSGMSPDSEPEVFTSNANTLLGSSAKVVGVNMSYATAIGAGSRVANNNTIVLGRQGGEDQVRIPGFLRLGSFASASEAVCVTADGILARCSASRNEADSRVPVLIRTLKEQQVQIAAQVKQIEELKQVVCAMKPEASVCGNNP